VRYIESSRWRHVFLLLSWVWVWRAKEMIFSNRCLFDTPRIILGGETHVQEHLMPWDCWWSNATCARAQDAGREGSETQRSVSKKSTTAGNFTHPCRRFKVNLDRLFIHSSIRVDARTPILLIHLWELMFSHACERIKLFGKFKQKRIIFRRLISR